MKKPPITMYVSVTPDKKEAKRTLKAVDMIAKSCHRLLVVALSIWEDPEAFVHPRSYARRIAERMLDRGRVVTIARKLMPSRPSWMAPQYADLWDELTVPGSYRRPEFYAATIGHMLAESRTFGVPVECLAHCEPHCENPAIQKWKDEFMDPRERRNIAITCRRARSVVGPVDVYPWGSGNPNRFMWPLSHLAAVGHTQLLGSHTYYRKEGEFHDKARPPLGYRGAKNVCPGFYMEPLEEPQTKSWTPAAFRKWLQDGGWDAYLKNYPLAEGPWLYCFKDVPAVARMLAKTFAGAK